MTRADGSGEARCPYCGAPVEISASLQEGDTLTCAVCDTPLQVVSLDPFELDYAWDDDLAREVDSEDGREEDEFEFDEMEFEEMMDDEWNEDEWDGDGDWEEDDY